MDVDPRLALADLYLISEDRSPNVPVILSEGQKHGLLTRAIIEWFRPVYADLGFETCSSVTGCRTCLANKRSSAPTKSLQIAEASTVVPSWSTQLTRYMASNQSDSSLYPFQPFEIIQLFKNSAFRLAVPAEATIFAIG